MLIFLLVFSRPFICACLLTAGLRCANPLEQKLDSGHNGIPRPARGARSVDDAAVGEFCCGGKRQGMVPSASSGAVVSA